MYCTLFSVLHARLHHKSLTAHSPVRHPSQYWPSFAAQPQATSAKDRRHGATSSDSFWKSSNWFRPDSAAAAAATLSAVDPTFDAIAAHAANGAGVTAATAPVAAVVAASGVLPAALPGFPSFPAAIPQSYYCASRDASPGSGPRTSAPSVNGQAAVEVGGALCYSRFTVSRNRSLPLTPLAPSTDSASPTAVSAHASASATVEDGNGSKG